MIPFRTAIHRIPERAAILLAVVLGPGAVSAADPKAPAPPSEPPPYRELWVPTEHLDAVLAKMPRAVMLTPEQYRALLHDAERGEKKDDPALAAPVAAVVRDVVANGELTNEVARITATYTVESFTEEWTEIPLVLPLDRLARITVDDRSAIRVTPAAGKGKSSSPVLVVRGKGAHSVSAEFHLPVSRSPAGNAIQFVSPGVAAASMVLTVPDGAKLDSNLPFVTGEEDPNRAKFVLPAEAGQTFEIRWTARDIDAIPEAAVFQTCSYLYSIDSTRVQADLGLVLSSSLAELPNRFEITLPAEVRILSVEGSELLSWDAVDADAGTGIEVVLVSGERQAADIRILVEADVDSAEDADASVTLPTADVAGVHRASGTMALIGADDVRVKNITTGPLTVAAPEALEAAIRDHPDFVAGFRFPVTTSAPEVTLSPVRERFNAQLDTRIEFKREAIHLSRTLSFIPVEGRLFESELELPAGEELLSITPADGRGDFSWNRIEGNRVRLAWQEGLVVGDAPPRMTVVTRLDPENWFELGEESMALSFTNAVIEEAETVSGYVAVAFDQSFRVETVTDDGLESRDARTTPVKGMLAWFRLSDYTLELNAARRPTEIEATVIAYALPLQSSLEIEGQLDLDIRYTPIPEMIVSLDPAVAKLVRWDSPLLAEKRLDETFGEWTLVFHEEQSGFQRLRFRMALPFEMEETAEQSEQKKFAVTAPVFSVPGAKRVRGDWVIEANTDTELNFEANGVDTVDSLRVPAVAGYQPRHRVIAAYQYRGDAYQLKIAGTRHAPEDLVSTVVDTLRLDTVVSTDGPDRHQARIGLRTTGEQFLEVGLPEGAVVWTLTVDGVAVKPVSVENTPNTLRVQLPAHEDASRRSILLKLIYQTPGKKWGGSGRESVQPIRLAGRIPVMRSEWFLHLPEGFDYQRFKSNLREDFQVIDRTLLGQVWQERDRFSPRMPIGSYELAAQTTAVPGTASRYVNRLQERVQKADEAALRAAQLLSDGDYQGAIAEWQAALDLIPPAPVTRDRFEAYLKQFANASVKLAQQRADEAEYEQARNLLESVLSPGVDPNHFAAKQLLERLDDPEYYAPALTPEHLRSVRRVEAAHAKARGFIEMGDYDRAEQEYWAVLNEDRYNTGARRSLEEVERQRMDYYRHARNHTRAEFLRRVAEGWELPVPVSITASSGTSSEGEGWEIPLDESDMVPVGNDLYSMTYRIPPDTYRGILDDISAQHANSPPDPFGGPPQTAPSGPKSPKELFESYGVMFGPGGGVDFNESTGKLVVRAEQDQQDLVGAVMESLRQNYDPDAPNLWAFRQSKGRIGQWDTLPAIDDMLETDADTDRISTIEHKLKSIIIPNVEFVNTPLRDALDYLRTRSMEVDPDPDPNSRGVDFVLDLGSNLGAAPAPAAPNAGPVFDTAPAGGAPGFGGGGAGDTKITLQLRNVPLGEALGYTLKLANLKYKVEPQAVVILPISAPDTELYTNTYVVPPSFLSDIQAGGDGGGGAAAPDPFAAPAAGGAPDPGLRARMTAKGVLEAYGINFGPGTSATYNPNSSTLIVRQTEDQMDLVEASIQSLSAGSHAPDPAEEAEMIANGIMVDSANGENFDLGNGRDLRQEFSQLGDSSVITVTESGDLSYISPNELEGRIANWKDSLDTVVIPEFRVSGLAVQSAVEMLEHEARKNAGGQSAIPKFAYNASQGASVSLNLKNVPLAEALRRITDASNTEFRVTASGVVIADRGTIPPEALQTLVLELPNSTFEVADADGEIHPLSARMLLKGAGIAFPPGTSAAYNRTTGRLAVKNTPINLRMVRELFSEPTLAQTNPGAFSAAAQGGRTEPVVSSAKSLGLKGFDFRHAGLIPLDFKLPESGRSYSFRGLYAPEPIQFRYVNWERQIRFAWFWILVGALAFWFGAVRRWKRPILIGLLGVILLTFIPLVLSQSLLAFCNSLLIGWLLGAALWLAWTIRLWFSRVFSKKEEEQPEAGEEAAVTA